MSLVIYTDGGARGNPGPAGIGIVIEDGGKVVGEIKKYLGNGLTNNWAEYQALIVGLTTLRDQGYANRELEIRMDSELIVKQMLGQYKVKHPDLKLLHVQVCALLADFPDTTFTHIRREKNKEADRLVNEAIDEAL